MHPLTALLPLFLATGAHAVLMVPSQAATGEQRCGLQGDNERCPDGQCCSQAGFCGTGKDFCSVPTNCQLGFGWCDSDVNPSGPSLSGEERAQVGAVPYGKPITSCTKPGVIALTFDDGPSDDTAKLLDILVKRNAKATFFVPGIANGRGRIDTTKGRMELIKRMFQDGHQIGSHSWSHFDIDALTSEERKTDLAKNERAIANILNKYPTYMRPPYMKCTGETGCLADLMDRGYHDVGYSVDSTDWSHPEDLDAMKQAFDEAFNQTAQDGRMLLIQHDTIHKSAIDLTEHILDAVDQKGWKAVTVGECLEDPAENWYRTPKEARPASMALGSCIVSQDGYCGTLDYFKDKPECWKSAQKCFDDAKKCFDDGKRVDKRPCQDMDNVCRQLMDYCTMCGATLVSSPGCLACKPGWELKLRGREVSCTTEGLSIDNPKA
ncbi:hypothetical protein PV08_03824 [Exophiala spinifera]|uniref:NodB homology domain-containing protein n=1 Tax=Exophiala spinifera TaxID=91928 RepID=A0A0D1YNH3_9EURO|nr:uncharacterized protein PV08_03824 [Exophiala spinifera]KIW16636.1 hypothetical protein PV08_03824 [Exophiala spinifera]